MSRTHPELRRVTIVVLDGLRPDAIEQFALFTVARLARRGASTLRATAVSPSVTAAAMATLLTGAAPERHGLQSDRFVLPRSRGLVHPWARLLSSHRLETTVLLAQIPALYAPVARGFAALLGVTDTRFAGTSCDSIAAEAARVLRQQPTGVIVAHLPDADRAGHAHGWMSAPYAEAARALDDALARIALEIDLDDPAELLMACADHGGGGAHPQSHASDHPTDTTIPLVLAGGAVVPGDLGPEVAFADLPATLLWAFGVPVPATYAGRPLLHAFGRTMIAA